ncbi:MAG: RNA-binding domain-containing protein [Thermoplasmatota archaeon]
MAKLFHYLTFRVHQHATEDPAKVRAALAAAAGVPLEKMHVEEGTMEGFHGNPILSLATELRAGQAMDRFFQRLFAEPQQRERLAAELPRRLDEEGNFFVRVAKQDALAGRVLLAADDDAIHVRGKVARFPGEPPPVEKLRSYLVE